MLTENAEIISNTKLKDEYYKVTFRASDIVSENILAGHFVHVKISGLEEKILRRPFSVFNVVKSDVLEIVYKVVGAGTKHFSSLEPGVKCNILGPLGNPYTYPVNSEIPVLVAGGYGSAAMYLIAKNSCNPGILLIGARNSKELILIEEYRQLGFKIKIATDDGSSGHKGLVTDLMEKYCKNQYKIYGCGPNPMMYTMVRMLNSRSVAGELSLDHAMCCGVGGCYTCVVKVKDGRGGWKYSRTCKEGPVFKSSEIYI
ncbi:MAG: dihydroorotate dehydrogenase electron transfer subunit [Victivallales bacterium]|nr:dihydroorotate dehydrogenase electron transfer subunit [Victivallales bacterium]MCF7888701.1 dihydroorotate dehydrogenase electron transfer subunit [Victivallales bacterium]